jgi:hypothetical protein
MAILRFAISPAEPCLFAIFKPGTFKFWILIENYITTNEKSGFLISCLKVSLKMATDGLMGKRKIAILNIDSI